MFNTALRITGNTADAEDILQESFADAFVQLQRFENKATFGAWLKQIVVNKSIGWMKKQKIHLEEMKEDTDIKDSEEVNEEEIAFTVASVKKAMMQLPTGYRTVLSLYLLEGYDQEEIAEIMQVAPSTVRTQYIRGKQHLLLMLKKESNHA